MLQSRKPTLNKVRVRKYCPNAGIFGLNSTLETYRLQHGTDKGLLSQTDIL